MPLTKGQQLVHEFCKLYDKKLKGKAFAMQIGFANNILREHDFEEVMELLQYAKDKSIAINSLAYLPYIYDSTRNKMLVDKQRELEEKQIKASITGSIDNKNVFKKKNMFKNNLFGGM